MNRRTLLTGIGTTSLLAVGVTTAAGTDCSFECCEHCERRDWKCGSLDCTCIKWCQYVE